MNNLSLNYKEYSKERSNWIGIMYGLTNEDCAEIHEFRIVPQAENMWRFGRSIRSSYS